MLVNHETQVTGTIMTLREFIGSLEPNEFYIQEISANEEIEYYPVEALISGIAPGLDEWDIEYVVVWWNKDTAIITRTIPGATGKTFLRKSLLLQEEMAFVCDICKKLSHVENVSPVRSIDYRTGCDTFLLHCKSCYDTYLFKVYGIEK